MSPSELRRRRKELGLTQRELAKLLRVNLMTVSRWERGDHRIPEAVALALKGGMPKRRRRR